MNFQLNKGDIVQYQITDKNTSKTQFKYGVYLYSYLRTSWKANSTPVPVMVLGRLFPDIKRTYSRPLEGNAYKRTYVAGLYMKKIFLWKNETCKVINEIEFRVGSNLALEEDEKIFLSLASDIVQSDYSHLEYSHE